MKSDPDRASVHVQCVAAPAIRRTPTRIRSDVVTRWMLARRNLTFEHIMQRMVPGKGAGVHFTVRGDAPSPFFEITRDDCDVPTLVSGCDVLHVEVETEILSARVKNGVILPPALRIDAEIPETLRLSVVGRTLSTILADRHLGDLGQTVVTDVGMEFEMLALRLKPEWHVHEV